jgi:hypothetical protein
MIRHLVMWRVSGDTPGERRLAGLRVKTAFEGLRGRIPGMSHLEVNQAADAPDGACDVVLIAEFDSDDALAAYATHAEHLRVRSELAGVRTARHYIDYRLE